MSHATRPGSIPTTLVLPFRSSPDSRRQEAPIAHSPVAGHSKLPTPSPVSTAPQPLQEEEVKNPPSSTIGSSARCPLPVARRLLQRPARTVVKHRSSIAAVQKIISDWFACASLSLSSSVPVLSSPVFFILFFSILFSTFTDWRFALCWLLGLPVKPLVTQSRPSGVWLSIDIICKIMERDYGEGGDIWPSRKCQLSTRKGAARPQSMCGCTCNFIVNRLYARPSVALIIYKQRLHVNKHGSICHRPLDRDAIGPKAKAIPYVGSEIQRQTMSMIYLGIPEENFFQKHTEGIELYCSSNVNDAELASQYVRKLEVVIRRSTHELDLDDESSIHMWVDRQKKSIFFFDNYLRH
ncbi:uncharacterized protein LOC116255537 isoform X1 [Nymphaea colorata]|nr:uncharacterized protein LOC116255537 isoform X1 [Nymphaea colorata]XP_049934121.1 uncharacterized protein LOC116255537 isoform X1 [Nymphaea colorata]